MFIGVLRALSFLLLVTSVIHPPPAHAAFPGANGKICFVTDRDGNSEIYVMNADGTGQTNLTNNPAADSDCAWSADGTKIAFRSGRDGNLEIYAMNADGSGQVRLTNTPENEVTPAWSPDGTKITYAKNLAFGTAEIFVLNADGSGQAQLTQNGVFDNVPVWSPDGTKIAFEHCIFGGDCEVYAINANGTGQTNLTNNPPRLDRDPDWSPDGTKIAFWSGGGGLGEIWVMNADGSGKTMLSSDPCDGAPVWSPDGTKIAFHSCRGTNPPNGEIYMMNADGSAVTRVNDNPASDTGPDWQPLHTDVPLLIIDEDSIDNGTKMIEAISFGAPSCGAGNPSVCVNDDIADKGVRSLLFTRGSNITPFAGLTLPTGQAGDAGLFRFSKADPQASLQNGAVFTAQEFIFAAGAAADENNLDKVDGVVPLSSADIADLEGKTVCAVVYDSDLSVDVAAGFGNLKGATLGLTAFKVNAVGPDPDGPEGSVLPAITVDLLPSSEVVQTCRQVVPPQPRR